MLEVNGVLLYLDRKSPNSSAVESEMELASGDEGGYLRKKSTMPSSSSTGQRVAVDEVPLEHLDFVWARAEGQPWMPGVVSTNTLSVLFQVLN